MGHVPRRRHHPGTATHHPPRPLNRGPARRREAGWLRSVRTLTPDGRAARGPPRSGERARSRKICEGFGHRVQKSVFECDLDAAGLRQLIKSRTAVPRIAPSPRPAESSAEREKVGEATTESRRVRGVAPGRTAGPESVRRPPEIGRHNEPIGNSLLDNVVPNIPSRSGGPPGPSPRPRIGTQESWRWRGAGRGRPGARAPGRGLELPVRPRRPGRVGVRPGAEPPAEDWNVGGVSDDLGDGPAAGGSSPRPRIGTSPPWAESASRLPAAGG